MNGAGLISCPTCDTQYSTVNMRLCPTCSNKPLPPQKHNSSPETESKPANRKIPRIKEPLKQHELRDAKYDVIMMTIHKPRIRFHLTDKINRIRQADPTFTAPSPSHCKRLYKKPDDDFLIWLMDVDPERINKNPLQREVMRDLRIVGKYRRLMSSPKSYLLLLLVYGTLVYEFRAERALQRLKDNRIYPQSDRL